MSNKHPCILRNLDTTRSTLIGTNLRSVSANIEKTKGTRKMNNAEYHAMPGISKSGLDLINRSPAHYRWAKDNPSDPTPAMRLGTLTHLAVLEPDRFNSECIVMPVLDRRTKDGKLRWEQFQADYPDHELLTSDEHTRIMSIRDAVRAHPMARKLMDRIAEVEVSTFWKDPISGIECRCRPDAELDNGMLIDLKTTRDAGPGFERSVRQYRYHVQAAFYGDGLGGMEVRPMVFIAVETEAPYLVSCNIIGPDSLVAGREAYRRNLDTYAKCVESGIWPGYSDAIQTINLPDWELE
jgi:exodeoxyribonuclease VIII